MIRDRAVEANQTRRKLTRIGLLRGISCCDDGDDDGDTVDSCCCDCCFVLRLVSGGRGLVSCDPEGDGLVIFGDGEMDGEPRAPRTAHPETK